MLYTKEEVCEYVRSEDVKFIRLAFVDAHGNQKNVSVFAGELERALDSGISFDGSAIEGFSTIDKSDMFLLPDPSTLAILPWRPSHGKVVRMFCDVINPDKTPYQSCPRYILKQAVKEAEKCGITVNIGTEFEFYLFKTDEDGENSGIPLDMAGYMDIAPLDKCENIRREICLALESMDIIPETSHHEEGPGQNEIDFRYSDALRAADNAVTFAGVVRTVASQNGLVADFSPKPLENESGNGLHINMSLSGKDKNPIPYDSFMAGIMEHLAEIAVFMNPSDDSYKRLGHKKAPYAISWSHYNRTQCIRIPAAVGEYERFEIRNADSACNPYIVYALLIYAGLDGIKRKLTPPDECGEDLYTANSETLSALPKLPFSLEEAKAIAKDSEFIKSIIPESILKSYKII